MAVYPVLPTQLTGVGTWGSVAHATPSQGVSIATFTVSLKSVTSEGNHPDGVIQHLIGVKDITKDQIHSVITNEGACRKVQKAY